MKRKLGWLMAAVVGSVEVEGPSVGWGWELLPSLKLTGTARP